MADETTTSESDTTTTTATKRRPWQRGGGSGSGGSGGSGGSSPGTNAATIAKVRVLVARVLWAICAICALILAVAVLLIAVDANAKNDLVLWIIHRADNVDLGFFDLTNPIKDWDVKETNPAEDVKTALFNYGIAAIVWLVIGKILDKVVRP